MSSAFRSFRILQISLRFVSQITVVSRNISFNILHRMTFKPSKNVRRLSRKDSYTPDQDMEDHVQQINDTLPRITEENPKYNVKEIQAQRSHTYRSCVELDIDPTKNNLQSIRYERRRRSQKRAKENTASQDT